MPRKYFYDALVAISLLDFSEVHLMRICINYSTVRIIQLFYNRVKVKLLYNELMVNNVTVPPNVNVGDFCIFYLAGEGSVVFELIPGNILSNARTALKPMSSCKATQHTYTMMVEVFISLYFLLLGTNYTKFEVTPKTQLQHDKAMIKFLCCLSEFCVANLYLYR